jgi:hypothetical protein
MHCKLLPLSSLQGHNIATRYRHSGGDCTKHDKTVHFNPTPSGLTDAQVNDLEDTHCTFLFQKAMVWGSRDFNP